MNFGNLIKIQRTKKNITLQELEDKSGISLSYISRLENNLNKTPSAETVFKLAEALDISMKEIQNCFDVKLKGANKEAPIKLIDESDYVLIKKAESLLTKIANNKVDYDAAVDEVLTIAQRLRKPQIKVICFARDEEYVINIRVCDKNIVNYVVSILEKSFKGKVRVIAGYALEDDTEESLELEDFVKVIQEFNTNSDLNIDEFIGYLKKTNY